MFEFLLTTRKEDYILTVYQKRGVVSSFELSKSQNREPFHEKRVWCIALFQRILMINREFRKSKWTTYINEYHTNNRRWASTSRVKPLVSYGVKACTIKKHIMLVDAEKIDKIELLKATKHCNIFSSTVCMTRLPLSNVDGFSLTCSS